MKRITALMHAADLFGQGQRPHTRPAQRDGLD
jgi:hypothetical protein